MCETGILPARPEPVEGPPFLRFALPKKMQGFDKLSPNGLSR